MSEVCEVCGICGKKINSPRESMDGGRCGEVHIECMELHLKDVAERSSNDLYIKKLEEENKKLLTKIEELQKSLVPQAPPAPKDPSKDFSEKSNLMKEYMKKVIKKKDEDLDNEDYETMKKAAKIAKDEYFRDFYGYSNGPF